MTADQINDLRDTFRRAMLDWDVLVSVKISDDCALVSFELWGTKIEDNFTLNDGSWETIGDCPHTVDSKVAAWQWIAMKLHEKLNA